MTLTGKIDDIELAGAHGVTVRQIALNNINVRIETDSSGISTPNAAEDTS